MERGRGAQRARRGHINSIDAVSTARGASRVRAGRATAKVRLNVGNHGGDCGELFVFQSPLLFRTIDLAQVVNTRVLLGSRTRANEIGNSNRCQQTDDRNDDHDFHQREATLARFIDSHTALFAFLFTA